MDKEMPQIEQGPPPTPTPTNASVALRKQRLNEIDTELAELSYKAKTEEEAERIGSTRRTEFENAKRAYGLAAELLDEAGKKLIDQKLAEEKIEHARTENQRWQGPNSSDTFSRFSRVRNKRVRAPRRRSFFVSVFPGRRPVAS